MDIQKQIDLLAPPKEWEPRLRSAAQRPARWPRLAMGGVATGLALWLLIAVAPPVQAFAEQSGIGFRMEQVWYFFTVAHTRPMLSFRPTWNATGVRMDGLTVREMKVAEPWSSMKLAQSAMPAMDMPKGFDPAAYIGKTTGASEQVAKMLASRRGVISAITMAGMFRGDKLLVREVDVRGLPALFANHLKDGRVERMTLVWSKGNRAYALSGVLRDPPENLSMGTASGIAGLIGVAESVE